MKCETGCLCKRHTVKNSGQFQVGHMAGPGWIAHQRLGWAAEHRALRKNPGGRGFKQSIETKARISEGLRQRNGNTTGENASNDYPPEYQVTRLLVFKRDDYACRICSRHGVLHAHHLNYDKTDNRLENLVTLCGTCHLRHHRQQYWPLIMVA